MGGEGRERVGGGEEGKGVEKRLQYTQKGIIDATIPSTCVYGSSMIGQDACLHVCYKSPGYTLLCTHIHQPVRLEIASHPGMSRYGYHGLVSVYCIVWVVPYGG